LKKIILIFSIVSIPLILNAQITFQKAYGGTGNDFGRAVQQTVDGGYILAGWTDSFGSGNYDMYLIKTNANGDTLWTRTFGTIENDGANSVQQTSDGGYIVCGQSNIYSQGGDIYLVKTNTQGNLEWSKNIGGWGNEWGHSVQQTNDGGYIITGMSNSYTATDDVYLVKTDALGDIEWTKTYGSSAREEGWCVRQTSDGGFIIAADRGSNSNYGAYIIKTDFFGDTLWTRKFGGAVNEQKYFIQQTADSGYIISGSIMHWNYDAFIAKTDINGNMIWKKALGGASSDYGYCVKQTNGGGYVTCGMAYSYGPGAYSLYLVKTDANGITIWSKGYANNTYGIAYEVQQTTDGGYILCGHTSFGGAGALDVYLIKTDAFGNSGCYEQNATTVSDGAAIQYSLPATIVSSGGIDTIPPTVQGGDAIVTPLCFAVSTEEINQQTPFYIFPNPTSENFTITFPEIIYNGQIEVFNMYGVKVFSENISYVSSSVIQLNNIIDGLYYVKIFNGGIQFNKKLIVEHN
jgi:type IX secretion system substrate protein